KYKFKNMFSEQKNNYEKILQKQNKLKELYNWFLMLSKVVRMLNLIENNKITINNNEFDINELEKIEIDNYYCNDILDCKIVIFSELINKLENILTELNDKLKKQKIKK